MVSASFALLAAAAAVLVAVSSRGWLSGPPPGQRVLVTGVSERGGASLALAYAFAEAGAHVALQGDDTEQLDIAARRCSELGAASTIVVAADVSVQEECEEVIEMVQEAPDFGRLDVLVLGHNLGAPSRWWLQPSSCVGRGDRYEHAKSMLHANVMSYFYLATMAMPLLSGSADDPPGENMTSTRHGQMVVLSGIEAKLSMPREALMSTTRHALQGFFDNLRLEISHMGLSVSITTCFLGDQTESPGNMATARAILRAAAAGQREFYSPMASRLLSLTQPWMPDFLDKAILATTAWRDMSS